MFYVEQPIPPMVALNSSFSEKFVESLREALSEARLRVAALERELAEAVEAEAVCDDEGIPAEPVPDFAMTYSFGPSDISRPVPVIVGGVCVGYLRAFVRPQTRYWPCGFSWTAYFSPCSEVGCAGVEGVAEGDSCSGPVDSFADGVRWVLRKNAKYAVLRTVGPAVA